MARISGKAGDVYAGIQLIHACDTIWDEVDDADVTETLDTTDHKVGESSMKFVCAAGLADGDIMGSDVITGMNLTSYTHLIAWAKHSLGMAAADIQVLLDEHASVASPTKIDLPALSAAAWKLCIVADAFTSLTATISVGLEQNANDPGAFTFWLDHVMAAKVIAGIKSWTLDYELDALEGTGFDSNGEKEYIIGASGWKGTFEGFKDGVPLTMGSKVHLQLGESATLTQGFLGTVIVTGLHPVTAQDGLVTYSYDYQGSHAIAVPTT